jgi:hypothetical protein
MGVNISGSGFIKAFTALLCTAILAASMVSCNGKSKTINQLAFEARKQKVIDDFP